MIQLPKSIAGIRIPDSELATAAYGLMNDASPVFLRNHNLRTYIFGAKMAQKIGVKYDVELGFISSVLHDIGLTPVADGDERFEIDGADYARRFLVDRGLSEAKADRVWDAIVLHTVPTIPMRKGAEAALVHLGAGIDVFGLGLDEIAPEDVDALLDAFPRENFTAEFTRTLLAYVERKPMQQAFTWTAEIGREHVHGFECPSYSTAIANTPFSE